MAKKNQTTAKRNAKTAANGQANQKTTARTKKANHRGGLKTSEATAEKPASRWTFLTNHSHVLIVLHAEPELVLREVANRVGITERAVQRVVQELEQDGVIRRERIGRKNRYEVITDSPLRHPIEAHRSIGDLLKLITG
ncbi:MAG: winged helix-turn-helix transcriptional regulator [Planctomycetota bacterium]